MTAQLLDRIHLGPVMVLVLDDDGYNDQNVITFRGNKSRVLAKALVSLINKQDEHDSLEAIRILQGKE